MDQQSTKSVSIDESNSHSIILQGEGKHLINTTKVLRGHKLKTQDFIKLQLMRFRYCSPVKYEEQIQQNMANLRKTTEFAQKYKGIQLTQEGEKQLFKMIALQRQKKSRQVFKRIKLFNPTTHSRVLKQQKRLNNSVFPVKMKPSTSNEYRKCKNWNHLNNTISFNKTEAIFTPHSINRIQFKSQNLGEKMNEKMNHMIDPSIKQHVDQRDVISSTIQPKIDEYEGIERILLKQKNQYQNSYLKQMKKRFKSKYEASMQVSRQLSETKTYNLHEYMHKTMEDSIFNSMELKDNTKDGTESKRKELSSKIPISAQKIQPYNKALQRVQK